MSRFLSLALLAALLAPLPAAAQQQAQQRQARFLYAAYFKIGYGDLDEWNRIYHEHSVPVLQQLRSEGVIEGWGAWQHQTGGEYNWRLAIRTYDWAQLAEFWDKYLGRLQQRSPEAMARTGRMVQAHEDEIFNIAEVHVPTPTPAVSHLYESKFHLLFSDEEQWNEMWSQHAAPVLEQAMKDGLLIGWVKLAHNTGGRYNWKVLYLFDSWDDIDDNFSRLIAALAADPARWNRLGTMIQSHDDVLWTAIPQPSGR